MAKKQKIEVQKPVATPAFDLKSLAKATVATPAAEAPKKKTSDRPVFRLVNTIAAAVALGKLSLAKIVAKQAEAVIEEQQPIVEDWALREYIKSSLGAHQRLENPQLVADNASAIFQVVNKPSGSLTKAADPLATLLAAGIRKPLAELLAAQVVVHQTTTTESLQTLEAQPETNAIYLKIMDFLQHGLAPAEVKAVIVTVNKPEVQAGFFGELFRNAKNADEVEAVFAVCKPQFRLSSFNYTGDKAAGLAVLADAEEGEVVKKTTTTVVTQKAAA